MTHATVHTDEELIKFIIDDDYQAFTIIYNRYAAAVKQFLIKVLKSDELTEDITQEVFIQLWANRLKLSQVKSFKAYLFIAARNRALDSLKTALRSEAAMGEIVQSFVALRNTIDEGLLDKEYRLFLDNLLATLPGRTRQIFALCREHGKSYDEVAQMLGISRNAVKNHMVLSMKVLGSSAKKELGISLTLLLACVFKG